MSNPVAEPEGTPEDSPSIQKAANDLRAAATHRAQEVAQSAEDHARQLKESAAQKTQQFREAAGEKATQIKEVAGEQWQETRVKARAAHADAEDYIRQHPTKAILIAAGAGFLLGLIVRR